MDPNRSKVARRRRLQSAHEMAARGRAKPALRAMLSLWHEVASSGDAPERATVARSLALVCVQLGSPEQALTHLQRSIDTGESPGWDGLALGLCRAELGDRSGAAHAFVQAHKWAERTGDKELMDLLAPHLK
jgi:Flp pilus assembly protein TadD